MTSTATKTKAAGTRTVTGKKVDTVLQGQTPPVINVPYYRFNKAAEILECSMDELLTLGATGGLEVMAPVFSDVPFELGRLHPIGAYPEINEPLQANFSPWDRVILSRFDLAHIEAAGWVIPHSFKCPSRAKEVIEKWLISNGALSDDERRGRIRENLEQQQRDFLNGNSEFFDAWESDLNFDILKIDGDDNSNSRQYPEYDPVIGLLYAKKMSLYGVWAPVEEIPDTVKRTTISDLFVSKVELDRMLKGQSSNSPALVEDATPPVTRPHGNRINNSADRESVLRVAIFVASKEPGVMKTATGWATAIEQEWRKYYDTQEDLPLVSSSIVNLLRTSKKTAPGAD